jgi:phenylacetic acid degradation operon negative regulatory protein
MPDVESVREADKLKTMSSSVTAAAPDPAKRLLQQIEMRAPSLLVTVWGDTIAPTGDAVWLGSLIRLAEDFGLNERVVRTAVFRLQKDGWLQSHQVGRRSFYDLAPAGKHLTTAADVRIYRAEAPDWDGSWLTLIAPPSTGGRRDRLARELRLQGFGQAAPGVFVMPGGDPEEARSLLKDLDAEADTAVLFSTGLNSVEIAPLRDLVARAWDQDAIDKGYAGFIRTFEGLPEEHNQLSDRQAFVVRTLLVHEFRRIILPDPMLPAVLLPPGQSGVRARQLAREIYWMVEAGAARHSSNILEGRRGRLSKPGPAYYHRFMKEHQPDTGEGGGW